MRKYLNWQIPFSDIEKTQYVIDIYANTPPADGVKVYYGAGIEKGGAIDSEEDGSDNPLEPMRGQTATIHLVNSEGNLDLIDEIMPRDNTKRFAQLWMLASDGRKIDVMWQGFLSGDSFSQDYVSRPVSIDLTVNSILNSMDFVDAMQYVPDPNTPMSERGVVPEDCMPGLMSVKEIIDYTIKRISRKTGVLNTITDYYVPQYSSSILGKLLLTYDFFSTETRTTVDSSDSFMKSISLKEILKRICSYMGWVARERGRAIYFQDVYDPRRLYEHHVLDADGNYEWMENVSMRVEQMANFSPRGTELDKSIARGARYVSVTSKLSTVEGLSLPDCPYKNIVKKTIAGVYWADHSSNTDHAAAIIAAISKTTNYHSILHLENYMKGVVTYVGDDSFIKNVEPSNIDEMVDNFPDIKPFSAFGDNTKYAGAALMRMEITYDPLEYIYRKMQTGLYCALLPVDTFAYKPIFRLTSARSYRLLDGYIHISANMLLGGLQRYNSTNKVFYTNGIAPSGKTVKEVSLNMKLKLGLRVGQMYWTGSYWTPTIPSDVPYAPFLAELEETNFKPNIEPKQAKVDVDGGLLIPVPTDANHQLEGEIELALFPTFENVGNNINTRGAVFFSELKVEYIRPFDHSLSDSTENKYFDLTGFSFDDTIEENLNIATYNGNLESPSIVLNADKTPMDGLLYDYGSTTKYTLPELRKLECMRMYYSAPRRVISMPVESPQDPCTEMVVVGYDGKTYLPLSERRDWIMRKSTIQFFEIGTDEADTDPDNDEQPGI